MSVVAVALTLQKSSAMVWKHARWSSFITRSWRTAPGSASVAPYRFSASCAVTNNLDMASVQKKTLAPRTQDWTRTAPPLCVSIVTKSGTTILERAMGVGEDDAGSKNDIDATSSKCSCWENKFRSRDGGNKHGNGGGEGSESLMCFYYMDYGKFVSDCPSFPFPLRIIHARRIKTMGAAEHA